MGMPPSPMRHLTKYTAYVRKKDGRIWGLKGEWAPPPPAKAAEVCASLFFYSTYCLFVRFMI